MKDSLVRYLILIPLILGACSPEARRTDSPAAAVDVSPTYDPPKPTVVKEAGFKIARGATKLTDIKPQYDAETRSMRLTGTLEYLRVNGGGYQKMDLNLVGMLDEDGFIVLKLAPEQKPLENMKVAAKATCLSAAGTCSSYFVDVYLHADGIVYHQQIEVKEKETSKPKPTPEAGKTVPPEDDKEADEEDDGDEVGGSDVAEGEAGPYIGSMYEDIETILEVERDYTPTVNYPTKEDRDEAAEKRIKEKEAAEKAKKDAEKAAEDAKKSDGTKKKDPKKPKEEEEKFPELPNGEGAPVPQPRPKAEDKKEEPTKEEPKKEEPKVTKPKVKPANQVVGSVNNGTLENGVNMKNVERDTKSPHFNIIRPERKRYFAANEMSYLIQFMGKLTGDLLPGYKLPVGDISKENGGAIGKHLSHKTGMDVDVAFFFKEGKNPGYFTYAVEMNKPGRDWLAEEQWKLFKGLVGTGLVDRIFIHSALKKELCKMAIKDGEIKKETSSGNVYETLRRLIADEVHSNHFHMRAKCSKAQIRCRPLPEPRHGTGCF